MCLFDILCDYGKVLELIESQGSELEEYVVRRMHDYMNVYEKSSISTVQNLSSENKLVLEATNRLDKLYDKYERDLCMVYFSIKLLFFYFWF